MKILVTGASGFIGLAVCRRLLAGGHQVVAALRRTDYPLPLGVEIRKISDLGPETRFQDALKGCDAVLHMAGRAHILGERTQDSLEAFRRVNREGTLALAEQALAAGIRRFLFISSIKVNGETTAPNQKFRAEDPANPADAYGQSKAEAEAGLKMLATQHGLLLTIVRPPLVHGPGAKGNLALLQKAIRLGLPLPLASIRNARSMVGVDNLADGMTFLLEHDATGCFLIRDGDDVSTPELIRALAAAQGRTARLLAVPSGLLQMTAKMVGISGVYERLAGSLVVDDTPLRHLGWFPPLTLAQGLSLTVRPAQA